MTNIQSTLTHHETIDGHKYEKVIKTIPVGNQFLTTITIVKTPTRPWGTTYRGDAQSSPEESIADAEKCLKENYNDKL